MRTFTRELVIAEPRKKISKNSLAVVPVWLGQRRIDGSDYDEYFLPVLGERRFSIYGPLASSDIENMEDCKFFPSNMAGDLREIIEQAPNSIVVIFILTSALVKAEWFEKLFSFVASIKRESEMFIYTVVLGGSFDDLPDAYKLKVIEKHALEKGIFYLRYSSDAPTPSCRRLVELMNRLIGCDLPGDDFPNYSKEEIGRIVWNINQESFNVWSNPLWAIPKYPIRNGKALLPIIPELDELTEREQKELLGSIGICSKCDRERIKNFCRACGDFFIRCGCPIEKTWDKDHAGHLTYL